MARQKPWDIYEAAILLDAYIHVAEGTKSRRQAIEEVSSNLRKRALLAGEEIDAIFRNIAGITFQMNSMESAYRKKTIQKPATKLFIEIVEIRESDKSRFEEILKEANGMAADNGREKYQEWLVENGMKYTAARNYGNWLYNINEYLNDEDYLRGSLYECSDVNKLVELYEKVSEKTWAKEHRDSMTSFRKYILYRSNGQIVLGRTRNPLTEDHPGRYEYQAWLEENGFKSTAARNYGNWLKNIDVYVLENGYSSISLFDIDETETLLDIFYVINEDEEIVSNHRDYLSSLKKYISYKSGGEIELARRRSNNDERIISQISEQPVKILMSIEEHKNFEEILKNHFEEGLVLNAIRLDMFRMLYKETFGSELSNDDGVLEAKLKTVGSFVDGRIYPKKDTKNSELLNEIREIIVHTLEEGASCIYISELLQRWKQKLSDELNIYNEDALRDIIMADNMDGVVSTSAVLKNTKEKVYPENDVISYMKGRHEPVKYTDFINDMWYIPLDTIKHVLVTTPSLVQVDFETYIYAPNFPASTTELNKLAGYLRKKLDDKGFLVSKDIAEIIEKKCPSIYINTVGYKDWAYRNVLKYLFREEFDFGSSVVCEKGKGLEMKHVYRSFCKDHERLTVSELKEFSNELGVYIYWDDVLKEMVRINEKELVRKDLIEFDVDAIDSVLEEFCTGDYITIKQVNLFLHFPVLNNFQWNSFVLESYLPRSNRFQLYHVSYSEDRVCGIIVRKNTRYENYRQVVVDMLANSKEWKTESEALELIVDKGYQARRRWSGFDKVMQEALAYREIINQDRK